MLFILTSFASAKSTRRRKLSLNCNAMNPLFNNKITTTSNDSTEQLQPGRIAEELLSQFSEPIISIDFAGKILLWNSGASQHFGCSSEMVLGKRLWDIDITALNEHGWQQLFQGALANTTTTKELIFKHKSGSSFTGNILLNVIKDDKGQPFFISGIIKDITSNNQQEKSLHNIISASRQNILEGARDIYNSGNPYLRLLENSFDVITLIDKSFSIIYRSPSSERIVGWTDQDIIGINVMQNVHPNDVERAKQVMKYATENPGVPTDCSIRLKHKNGSYVNLEGKLINLLHVQEIGAYVFNFHDVTERVKADELVRKSEEKYREVVERISEAFFSLDHNQRFVYVNKAAEKIIGKPAEMLLGNLLTDVFPAVAGNQFYEAYKSAIATKKPITVKHYSDILNTHLEVEVFPGSTGITAIIKDVGEETKARNELRKSEEKYRQLVERITEGFTALDKDWRFTYVNAQAAKTIGRPAEELLGKVIWEEYPRLIGTNTYIALTTAMETQRYFYNIDYDRQTDWWFENHVYPSENGVSAIIKNITAKTKAEISARDFQETKDQILRSALDAIVGINMEGEITIWNQQAERLFGWLFKEVVGKNVTDIIIAKQHRDQHFSWFPVNEASAPNLMLNKLFEITGCRIDGSEFPIELFIVTLKDNSENMYCAFIRDITDRKLAQQEIEQSRFHLNQAQSVAHVGSWQKDFKTGKGYWSDETYRIYGLGKDEYPGSDEEWLNYIHPEDRERVVELIQKSAEKLSVFSAHFRILRKDGEERYVYSEGRYEFDAEGKPTLLFGIIHDITENKRLELALNEAQRLEQSKLTETALQAQEKERNTIGQELHDNVNQILVGTKMYLAMVKKDPWKYGSLVSASMENIQDAINENRRIAHELVAPELNSENFISQIETLTENMLRVNGVGVQCNKLGFNCSLLLQRQLLAVYRIIQEQYTNIIKYSKANLVNVFISTANSNFRLIIADDGAGADLGKKTKGIGLKNVESRISVFGGKVKIKTTPGKGFMLDVQMPLNQN